MNKIINKQVLATFALVTIMAGVLIGTNCIYCSAGGKEDNNYPAYKPDLF